MRAGLGKDGRKQWSAVPEKGQTRLSASCFPGIISVVTLGLLTFIITRFSMGDKMKMQPSAKTEVIWSENKESTSGLDALEPLTAP
jgi:hypothetical protein